MSLTLLNNETFDDIYSNNLYVDEIYPNNNSSIELNSDMIIVGNLNVSNDILFNNNTSLISSLASIGTTLTASFISLSNNVSILGVSFNNLDSKIISVSANLDSFKNVVCSSFTFVNNSILSVSSNLDSFKNMVGSSFSNVNSNVLSISSNLDSFENIVSSSFYTIDNSLFSLSSYVHLGFSSSILAISQNLDKLTVSFYQEKLSVSNNLDTLYGNDIYVNNQLIFQGQDIDKIRTTLLGLSGSLSNFNNTLNNLIVSFNGLTYQNELLSITGRLNSIENNIISLTGRVLNNENQIGKLEASYNSQQGQIGTINNNISTINGTLNTQGALIAANSAGLAALTTVVGVNTTNIATNTASIATLQGELSTQSGQIQALENGYIQLDSEMNVVQAQNTWQYLQWAAILGVGVGSLGTTIYALTTNTISDGSMTGGLYHTTSRVRQSISSTGNITYNQSLGQYDLQKNIDIHSINISGISNLTIDNNSINTDIIPQGSSNLYSQFGVYGSPGYKKIENKDGSLGFRIDYFNTTQNCGVEMDLFSGSNQPLFYIRTNDFNQTQTFYDVIKIRHGKMGINLPISENPTCDLEMAADGIIKTNHLQSKGTILNLGENSSTVNIACSPNIQSVNIGGNGTTGTTTINIGGANDIINIAGSMNYISTTNLAISDKTIQINKDAIGSGTARNGGIYIRDNNIDNQGYIETSSLGTSWTLKAPENNFILSTPILTQNETIATLTQINGRLSDTGSDTLNGDLTVYSQTNDRGLRIFNPSSATATLLFGLNNGTIRGRMGVAESAGAMITNSSAGDFVIRQEGTNSFWLWQTNGTNNYMKLDSAGNFGFGKSGSYRIDVNGDVNISGLYRIGGSQISTNNVLEGTNLYFTNARASSAISSSFSQLVVSFNGLSQYSNTINSNLQSLVVSFNGLSSYSSTLNNTILSVSGNLQTLVASFNGLSQYTSNLNNNLGILTTSFNGLSQYSTTMNINLSNLIVSFNGLSAYSTNLNNIILSVSSNKVSSQWINSGNNLYYSTGDISIQNNLMIGSTTAPLLGDVEIKTSQPRLVLNDTSNNVSDILFNLDTSTNKFASIEYNSSGILQLNNNFGGGKVVINHLNTTGNLMEINNNSINRLLIDQFGILSINHTLTTTQSKITNATKLFVGGDISFRSHGRELLYNLYKDSGTTRYITSNNYGFAQRLDTSGNFIFSNSTTGNADGTATLVERFKIEQNGNLSASGNMSLSGNALFGNAKLGKWSVNNDFCYFQNSSLSDSGTNYALIQSNLGRTILNSETGQPLSLRIGSTEIIGIRSTKLVGINCEPESALHVVGTRSNVPTKGIHMGLLGGSNDDDCAIEVCAGSVNNASYIDFTYPNTDRRGRIAYVNSTDVLFFETGATERFRISSAGNVGIGNISPNAPLQFANVGAERKIVLYELGNNNHQFVGLGASGGLIFQNPNTSDSFTFRAGTSSTTSNTLFRILGSGNTCVGGASPTEKLQVSSGNFVVSSTDGYGFHTGIRSNFSNSGYGEIYVYNHSAPAWAPLSINEAGNVWLCRNSGDVSIGHSSPNNRLDIQRDTRQNTHPTALALYATKSTATNITSIVEFRHANATQGIGFGWNSIFATGSNTDQEISIRSRGNEKVSFWTNTNERFFIEGGGTAEFTIGCRFPSSGGTKSVLSHYEENSTNYDFKALSGSSTTTITIRILRIGKHVTVTIPPIRVDITTTVGWVDSQTNLPTRFRPAVNDFSQVVLLQNSGQDFGIIKIFTTGLIRLERGNNDNFPTYTNDVGSKNEISCSYSL